MIKLNNKGFSLVEVLAVVVIMGVLATIMVPVVASIINQNKADNLDNLKKSITSAAKLYISDNRYELSFGDECVNGYRVVSKDDEINNGKISIKTLVDGGYLSNNIKNPANSSKLLDIDNNYVVVEFDCNSKDFNFKISDDLVWK